MSKLNQLKNKLFTKENGKSAGKFLLAGLLTTLIDYVVYILLSQVIPFNTVAKLISIVVASVVSFFINRNWSFKASSGKVTNQIWKFAICQGINIGTNVGVNALMFAIWPNKTFAFVVGTGFAMCVNFAIQRFWVFRKKNDIKTKE